MNTFIQQGCAELTKVMVKTFNVLKCNNQIIFKCILNVLLIKESWKKYH